MYLVLYKKKNKLYFNTVDKLTEKFTVTNEYFQTVNLGYRNKIASYKFNDWNDFKKIKDELKKYGLRILISKSCEKGSKSINLVIMLMNNPFYAMTLKKEDYSGDDELKLIEINSIDDWHFAEDEFSFESDFYQNIL
jgi:hypothetical protein